MNIKTQRLTITRFDLSMAQTVHENSLDDDNRKFVPDEVFETVEHAKETLEYLIGVYRTGNGPLVCPVVLKSGENIGYVQLVPIKEGYEIGYHIAKKYTRKGYATEAVKAFLSYIMPQKNINKVYGICVAENTASVRVMEKCGFTKEYEGVGLFQSEEKHICRFVFEIKNHLLQIT